MADRIARLTAGSPRGDGQHSTDAASRALATTYRSLLRSNDEGFCVIEILVDEEERPGDYRFIEVNEAFERQSGLASVKGRRVRELLPDLGGEWLERYGRIALTGEPERWEDEIAELGRWFDVYAWRVGRPSERRVAVSFRDITQRRQAEGALRESEERLRLAKDAADLGIHDYDPVTGVIRWDERVRELWGLGPDEPVDYDVFMGGIHPDDRERTQAAVVSALDPAGVGEYVVEYRVTCRVDGRTRWLAVTGQTTFEDGRAVRLVGTVQDITERKRVETELREALAAKDQFLGFISHELRTPMTVILGTSRLLARKLMAGAARDMASDVASSAEELNDLIDSLLLLARAEGGRISESGSPSHLGRIIERVLERQRERDPDREYLYRADASGPVVDGEEAWLERVLVNLVGNAAKYSPPGRPVTVVLEDGEREVRVRVLDEGDGLDEDEVERLFEPFVRGAAHDGRVPGAGLGLTVCRRIVESMAGRMWARTRADGGAEFGFAVPTLSAEALSEA